MKSVRMKSVRMRSTRSTNGPPVVLVGLLAVGFALPLGVSATAHALVTTPTVVSVQPASLRTVHSPDVSISVHATTRAVRVVAQEAAEQRRHDRLARQHKKARQERAQRQADRQERRELNRWVMPIVGADWSAPFGQTGSIWSSGYHTGQDFTAPYGTPVLAAGSGIITFAGWSDAYGNKIEITHPDGNQTWYAHMSSLKRTSGAVAPGDVIGYVGCTGNCYGNHLHFEFHPGGGAAADPIAWLRSHGAV